MNLIKKQALTKIKLHFQRFEFKYQLPLEIVEGMIPEFLKYMKVDPYAQGLEDNAYTVSSLYYDSVGLDCYYQKLAGLRTRKKLRVRFYEKNLMPESKIFLEIKKKYDTVVVKDRLTMSYQNYNDLLKSYKYQSLALNKDEKDVLQEFLWLKIYNRMIPQNMVIYKRKPFVSKVDGNFRVTIDYDLKTFMANNPHDTGKERYVNTKLVVLEVKFNNVLPFWFENIIKRYNLEQRPFSKYANCLELCKPGLIGKRMLEVYQNGYGININN